MLETYDRAEQKVSLVLRRIPPLIQCVTAVVIAALLALPPEAAAQPPNAANPPAPAQTPAPSPLPLESLTIYVLQGQNEIHDIRDRVAAMAVVEVRDENGLPIEGADVTFTLPPTGPGASFAGQQFTYTSKTNFQGQAAATFLSNMQTGRFTIRVAAKVGNRVGQAVIRQTNSTRSGVAEPSHGILKFAWWKVAVLAGVGAAVGVVVATRGGGSSPSVALIPGSPTFGAP